MERLLHTAELPSAAPELCAGDRVLLSGTVYTARDAAHKRLFALLNAGEPLPLPLDGATIYHAGPTPAPEGMAIGSCGPTTSGRMDPYAPRLLRLGLCGIIGKGERNAAVCEAIRETGGVYFNAVGGAGALIARCITAAEVIAFPELGCEAIRALTVARLPLIVAIDARGGNLFCSGRAAYAKD